MANFFDQDKEFGGEYMERILNVIKIFFLLLFSFNSPAYAVSSWYSIDNYEGAIGDYPVHMSLQMRTPTGTSTISGSYYYDKRNSPIPLKGFETQDEIVLCEVNGDKEYDEYIVLGNQIDEQKCPFTLTKTDSGLKGKWNNKKKEYPVLLNKKASMNPSSVQGEEGNTIDIPFWGQTSKHSFIGVYEGKNSNISISKVNVVDKSTGQIVQTMDPQKYDCHFGFYMTAVFRNLESDIDKSRVLFNCYSTERDVSIVYQWKRDKKAYVVVKE